DQRMRTAPPATRSREGLLSSSTRRGRTTSSLLDDRLGHVHVKPAQDAETVAERENTEDPGVLALVEQVAGQQGTAGAGQVADHVHGAAEGAGVALADVGTRRPGRPHAQVVEKEDETEDGGQPPRGRREVQEWPSHGGGGHADHPVESPAPFAVAGAAD